MKFQHGKLTFHIGKVTFTKKYFKSIHIHKNFNSLLFPQLVPMFSPLILVRWGLFFLCFSQVYFILPHLPHLFFVCVVIFYCHLLTLVVSLFFSHRCLCPWGSGETLLLFLCFMRNFVPTYWGFNPHLHFCWGCVKPSPFFQFICYYFLFFVVKKIGSKPICRCRLVVPTEC